MLLVEAVLEASNAPKRRDNLRRRRLEPWQTRASWRLAANAFRGGMALRHVARVSGHLGINGREVVRASGELCIGDLSRIRRGECSS